ncbi:MAG TPA: response regulator [Polyangiaceae bacterium]|nr:response regulator [Polyangiaceae bacterium]
MNPIVLFVDDDQALLAGIRRLLQHTPFDVLIAHSVDEAQRILASAAVQVIVSDERMPGGSGTELLQWVRERYPHVVRIALTGESNVERAARLIEQGEVYRFLSKPIDRAELLRTLERALAMRHFAEEQNRVRQSMPRKSAP